MKQYILILSLLICQLTAAAQTKVEARLDSTSILVGSQTELHINATVAEGQKVDFGKVVAAGSELAPGLEVIDVVADTTIAQGDAELHSRIYTLTAWDEGTVTIPAQKVGIGGKAYTTKSLPLKVLTVKVDTTQNAMPRPAEGVQDNPFSWSEWQPLVWLSLLALLLLIGCALLWLRLRSNKPMRMLTKKVHRLQPHEKALRELAEIKAEQAHGDGDQKEYYTRLTDTLRTYLSDRFGIDAMEMTSPEIIDRLKHEEDPEKIRELREVFETADLVKFAKYSTESGQGDVYLNSVARFVADTKKDIPEEPEPEAVAAEAESRRKSRSRRMAWIGLCVVIVIAVALIAYVCISAYMLLA